MLGRFETLGVTRDQLRQRQREVQEQTDNQRAVLQRYTGQQSCLLLQKNNLLSQLQTQLDQTRLEALRWVYGLLNEIKHQMLHLARHLFCVCVCVCNESQLFRYPTGK